MKTCNSPVNYTYSKDNNMSHCNQQMFRFHEVSILILVCVYHDNHKLYHIMIMDPIYRCISHYQ